MPQLGAAELGRLAHGVHVGSLQPLSGPAGTQTPSQSLSPDSLHPGNTSLPPAPTPLSPPKGPPPWPPTVKLPPPPSPPSGSASGSSSKKQPAEISPPQTPAANVRRRRS